MSGFSPEWLALREPADHRARNEAARDAALAHLKGKPAPRLVDLGCGSGSNLRALAPLLPDGQIWRLVDADPILLQAARVALCAWADRAEPGEGDALILWQGGKRIEVHFEEADLARDLDAVLDRPADLITAAAFFDLVAPDWLAQFCAGLVARRLPLFTVLTYDGNERWSPPHDADAAILAAFHAHQTSDKGFGQAAGPGAFALMDRAFRQAGWRVSAGESPWRLSAEAEAQLIAALAQGAAGAVAETGLVPPADLASWLASRRVAQTCEIGHMDVFAAP
jgi:hypothetical protein